MWLLLPSPDSRLNVSLIDTVQSEKDLLEIHMILERIQPPIAQQFDLCHPMLHPDTSNISYPHQPLASMWVVALHYLLCNRTHPYPVTLLSTFSGHFWAKRFFPMNTPTFLKHSHSTPIRLWRWDRQSVPKRRHIKFRCRGITEKKTYSIQNTANVWNWV